MDKAKKYKGTIRYTDGATKTEYEGNKIILNKISLKKGFVVGNTWVNPNHVLCIDQWEVKK